MSTVILNGDQIYTEELIRENARLTVQHEADLQVIQGLSDRVEQLEAEAEETTGQEACEALSRAQVAEAKLAKAIETVHFLMAGGDPCTVCIKSCMMGENCKDALWTEAARPAERAGYRQ